MADNENEDLKTTQAAVDANYESDADDHDVNAPFASWLFLLTGLIAGALAIPAIHVVTTEFSVPLPAEYEALTNDDGNAESSSKAAALLQENEDANHSRFLIAIGSTIALVFGWATGFIHGRILFGIIGAVVGIAVAVGLGMFLPRPILDLQETAVQAGDHADFYSMAVYASQWLLFALPVVFAVGIGVGRPSSFIKAAGVGLMAAILGGVLYVIVGTILNPGLNLAKATPHAGTTGLYLWAMAAPLLTGLFMARTRL